MTDNAREQLKKIKICDMRFAVGCNFRCKMCYFWQTENPEGVLSVDDWKRFIDQLTGFFGPELRINISGGGEVLIREGAEELLEQAGSKFSLSLNTNGYLIDERVARLLARNLDAVGISLDGAKAQTHDYLRGMPGAYERVVSAVRYLRRESPDLIITMNTVILEKNLDELVDLVKWVERHQVNGIIFQAVTAPSNTPDDDFWYKNKFRFLWPEYPHKAVEVIDKLIGMKRGGSQIVNSVSQLEYFKTYFLSPEKAGQGLRCEYERALKVEADGNVKICDFSVPVGNIKDQPLDEILASELACREREKASACRRRCHLLINCFHDQENE